MQIRYPNLKAKCPDCGRQIVIRDAAEATTIHRRTCRGCRAVWQIKAETLKNDGGCRFDQLTFWRA